MILLLKEGDKAPDFTLQADDETFVSLSDFIGKKVVLYFYPKDGSSSCTREALEFKDLAQEFEKEGAIILGVSKDSVKSHQKFKQKNELPFTLLSDPETKVLNLYGAWKEKKMYGRTYMGTERTTFLINEEGIIAKVYSKLRVKGHAQVCLLSLNGKS